jgi:predicted phosphate transport protein (TIGR00153 family)
MANLLQFFIPQDKKFFPLFEKATDNLLVISKVLVEMVGTSNIEKRKELIREIEKLEHVGDAVTHEIFHELSANFITPFDREDIHALVTSIDDVVDFIHGSAKRIELYGIVEMPTPFIKLAELILQGSEQLQIAVSGLKDIKKAGKIREACVKINSIENHADDIFDMTIARLFEEETNAITIIKHKEILYALEEATDKCEDAANAIESIVIKYS